MANSIYPVINYLNRRYKVIVGSDGTLTATEME